MKFEKITIDDTEYHISIGNNAQENDQLIKSSHQDDFWFHLENQKSCHVILHNHGDVIPKRYLNQVAGLVFKYTHGANTNSAVIYTHVRYVTRTSTPGSVYTRRTQRIKF